MSWALNLDLQQKEEILKLHTHPFKTTTIDMICSLVQADAGEIKIGNTSLDKINTESWRKNLVMLISFPFCLKRA